MLPGKALRNLHWKERNKGNICTQTWWGCHFILVFASSVWINHLNDYFIVCFKVKVANGQAVVGSFSFLKEECLARSQITVSALVVLILILIV